MFIITVLKKKATTNDINPKRHLSIPIGVDSKPKCINMKKLMDLNPIYFIPTRMLPSSSELV